jgi:hypothetical protein
MATTYRTARRSGENAESEPSPRRRRALPVGVVCFVAKAFDSVELAAPRIGVIERTAAG